jgi:uncharacterized protein
MQTPGFPRNRLIPDLDSSATYRGILVNSMAVTEKITQICQGLDMLQEDTSVPRNIRRGAEDAKKLLLDDGSALDVRKASAINILDDLANDPNIPLHGRTLIWNIMSQLETI